MNWKDLFLSKVNALLVEASKYPNMRETIPKLKKYFQESEELIPKDEIAVLFHNDYQPQNFIIDGDTKNGKDNDFVRPRGTLYKGSWKNECHYCGRSHRRDDWIIRAQRLSKSREIIVVQVMLSIDESDAEFKWTIKYLSTQSYRFTSSKGIDQT